MKPTDSGTERSLLLKEITRYRLANGMQVWSHARPGTGTVALALLVKAGVRHETRAFNGITHFLEHMMLTGTERWTESEVMDVIRQQGGVANAQTTHDDTTFYVHIDARHTALALEWLHQVVFRPVISADKVEKERRVIVNEKGGEFGRLRAFFEWVENHDLGWNVHKAIQRRIMPDSPLELPVIGTDESLKRIDHAALVRHYEQYFVPGNMILLAVGDFEHDTLRAQIEATVGAIPAGEAPPEARFGRFVPAAFSVRLRGPAPNEQGQFLIGAPLGSMNHPDRHAWWLLSEVLERALMEEVRSDRGLTYDLTVYTRLYPEGGYFGIYTQTDVHNFPEVRQIVDRQMARLRQGDFNPDEVDHARSALRGRALLGLQSNADLLWWHYVDAVVIAPDEPVPDYFGELDRVDEAALVRVTEQYLRPEQCFTVMHQPAFTPRRAGSWMVGSIAALAATAALRRRSNGRAIPR
ncbi:MAG: pitrilysin family protein [Anaerolineae bacterium]